MTTGPGFQGDEPDAGRQSRDGSPPRAGRQDDGTFADVLNGFSFGTVRGRRKRKQREDADETGAEPARQQYAPQPPYPTAEHDAPSPAGSQQAERPYVEPHATQWPTAPPPEREPAPRDPGPAMAPRWGTGVFEGAVRRNSRPGEPEPLSAAEETGFVRPYALTGGRTRSSHALELETLISTNHVDGTLSVPDHMEHRSIVEECQTPRSVAEIAALLRVPLGVARVLISDVADAGLVTVHKTISGSDGAEAHFTLMERVLSGLRRL
ncbi:hypothetical protein CFN78_05490 [Amycolatopsis antarctica]|uniref:DUF742 domain-containing protein n=1 Tax=Amycolatopsis antarctica TaxID=1854586 RepID=A0A263D7Q5_9PSEU|nr:DUF742 domain-containing protein [Amycolatopsis antarctica]OZM74564.1 hypothetical protein CFN78_05490 [Amycolatopsis antarctica]